MRHTPKPSHEAGFTFVEIAIIAPIVILMIGSFITVIVNMTSEVLRSRGSSQLAFNVQDSLNRIDQDVKLSVGFLAQNSVTLQSPQGYDDGTASFNNVSSTNGTMLILTMLATTGNPLSSTSSVAYLSNKPNACGNSQGNNTPLTYNVVYFVKNSTLWRRVVMPSGYDTSACNATGTGTAAPWQRPSCSPGYNNTFCKAEDEALVTGINQTDFVVTYYDTANATIANSTASDANASTTTRATALKSIANVSVSINASQSIAGDTVSQSSSLRSTRLDTNASIVADPVQVSTPSVPSVSGIYIRPAQASFSWPTSTGNGTITYSLDYCIGATAGCTTWTAGLTNSSATNFTVPGTKPGDIVNARVRASNYDPQLSGSGTSAYSTTSTVTIPAWQWVIPTLINNWSNFDSGFVQMQYTKTPDNVVYLEGLIKRTGTYTSGEVITTLADGYRPAYNSNFNVATSGSSVGARIEIQTNGNVIASTDVSTTWLSLSNIHFVAADAPYTWNNITLNPSNGWGNRLLAGDPPSPAYTTTNTGRVFLRGTLTVANANSYISGTAINNALPSAQFPATYYIMPLRSGSGGFNEVGINASGILEARGIAPGSAYFLFTDYLPSSYTNWTAPTLQNSWVNFGGIHAPVGYTKTSDGVVTLKGLIKNGTTGTGVILFNLPTGYRPVLQHIFHVSMAQVAARVDVLPNGNVVLQSTGSNAWISLSNISFVAGQ